MPVLDPVIISANDLRVGADGYRPRFRWPWPSMQPGDEVDVIAPAKFIKHVTSCACSYARTDGSVKMRTRVVGRNFDDETRTWRTQLRVTCHATGV